MQMKKRIVITGGPGGGKTTALDLFHRELAGKIASVPEAATMIFSGGIERSEDPKVLSALQVAIFNLQRQLEDVQRTRYPGCLILCDRGSLDGVAYWPGKDEDFYKAMDTTLEDELSRYDAVIFFETAARSGQGFDSNNPVRNESEEAAIEIDSKLQTVWSQHKNFNLVKSSDSFIKKIMFGVATIENVINQIE